MNYDFLIIVQDNSKTGITVSTYAEIDVATLVTQFQSVCCCISSLRATEVKSSFLVFFPCKQTHFFLSFIHLFLITSIICSTLGYSEQVSWLVARIKFWKFLAPKTCAKWHRHTQSNNSSSLRVRSNACFGKAAASEDERSTPVKTKNEYQKNLNNSFLTWCDKGKKTVYCPRPLSKKLPKSCPKNWPKQLAKNTFLDTFKSTM